MAILFTKAQAMKALPFIEDKALYKAVDLALWLYLDKHWSFKNAVNKAAEKHAIKPKVTIERALRSVIPEEVFFDRMHRPASPSVPAGSKNDAIRTSKLKRMEKNATSHFNEITKRR